MVHSAPNSIPSTYNGLARPPRSIAQPERVRASLYVFVEGLERVREQIKAERRQSHHTQALEALPDGRIDFGLGPMYFEQRALRALAQMNRAALPRAGELLVRLDPAFRSELINHQLRHKRRYHLRTRIGPSGHRQVYAVFSESYRVFDADMLIDSVLDDVHDLELTGTAFYNTDTTDFEMSLLRTIEDPTYAGLGDVFRWGLRYSTNDAGRGAIRGSAVIERLACLNMAEFYTERDEFLHQTHRGEVNASMIRASIGASLAVARDLSYGFVDQWGILRDHSWLTLGPTIGDAYEALVRMAPRHLGPYVLKRKRETIVAMLVEGWRLEVGETLADLINGITAAHKLGVPAPLLAKLEVAAGRLMPLLVTRVNRW